MLYHNNQTRAALSNLRGEAGTTQRYLISRARHPLPENLNKVGSNWRTKTITWLVVSVHERKQRGRLGGRGPGTKILGFGKVPAMLQGSQEREN